MNFQLYRFTARALQPAVGAIGFYDGVHRGHVFLLQQVVDAARREGEAALAVTFARHPRLTLAPTEYFPQQITTLAERLQLLSATGLDGAVVLDFTPEVAALTAEQFMRLLREECGICHLVLGYDHRFGSDRLTNTAAYAAAGFRSGVRVEKARALTDDDVAVSSSSVRRCLIAGNVDAARAALGRPYRLDGTVEHGRARGRQLGFPTANLHPASDEKIVPGSGVYAAIAEVDATRWGAMVNIGYRPTLDDGRGETIEAHLFALPQGEEIASHVSLYGKPLALNFLSRLREERRFDSIEALRNQLQRDEIAARQAVADFCRAHG